tara:strand:- start:682 stop:1476 length:795 start_codon:yes stop_codon:yes gene_type:complete
MPGYDHRQRKTSFSSNSPGYPSNRPSNSSSNQNNSNRFYSPSSVNNNPARISLPNKTSATVPGKSGFSFSTKDVRSSPADKEAFRIRTGSEVMTPSERIARTKAYITGNNKFIDMPIFTPDNISYEDLAEIASSGESLIDYEQSTGKLSKDWKDWFKSQVGFQDITGDSYDETSKGFYDDENEDLSSSLFGGSSNYGYGGGGGGGGSAAAYAMMNQGPKQLGDGENVPGQTELLDYMIRVNKYNPYTKMAMPQMAGGGIMELVR